VNEDRPTEASAHKLCGKLGWGVYSFWNSCLNTFDPIGPDLPLCSCMSSLAKIAVDFHAWHFENPSYATKNDCRESL